MHTLYDNARVLTLGSSGMVTNGGTFGAPALYVQAGFAEYHNFLLVGTGSAAASGTLNVWQGTDSSGGSAKIISGATLNFGTSGTAWGITVKSDQLDTANRYTFLSAVGTTPSSGTYWVGLTLISTWVREAPGTSGLNGSVYVVA
jgi:hypothetical protein